MQRKSKIPRFAQDDKAAIAGFSHPAMAAFLLVLHQS